MQEYIENFSRRSIEAIKDLPHEEIAKALNILQAVYERDGRVYVFGNGGSLALATHWVADFNKTVFGHGDGLEKHGKRFQAIRVPSTEEEMTAWANDIGYDMVFAGPLQNYLQDSDVVIAISSSGNSPNVIKAVELAKKRNVPVIGLTGFDGGKLNELADAKILVKTKKGDYGVVEGVHGVVLHLMTEYFKDYFGDLLSRNK
ncbi:MAG: SIS domain-containing protein [Patescibacteria group bacterium]|nr:SIS domain-containing protein [Patescibacteria group bacterium]MDE2015275.1 SIS domain-containing protein [Patescibacteria group bacterium]MDE2227081.1 SIS domain-containing protein [Patescibacteria group bacterium]